MAQQTQGRPTNEIGFREIELLKDETLGVGSYGSVCKARCDHLLCAAKIIHPTLVPLNALQQISPQREHRLPIRRFEMECDFLKEIRHPNIIQYLGIYRDPETGLPVLLMELMDESLTHFLESSTEPIPYHIQLTICLDIVQALSFLHLNSIIHRDLSSNNILLIGKDRAKLTDFGMAKLVDVCMSRVSNTMCPGTDAYMPPEAIDNQAVYTEKGDVFSFGVNIIQILTRKFPKPGDRFQTVPINDPRFPSGRIRVCVSEIDRRNNHICEIEPAHPLLPIALDCLKDQESERPSAGELYQRLAALKDTPEYTESETSHQHHITELRQQLLSQQREHDEQIQQSQLALTARQQEHDEQIQQAQRALTTRQQEHDEQIQQSQRALTARQQEHDEQIQQSQQALTARQLEHGEQLQQSQQALTARQQEIQDLRKKLSTAQATVREKEQIITTRDRQQRDHEDMIAQFQTRVEELELNSRSQPCAQSLSSSDIARASLPSRLQPRAQHPRSSTTIARATPPTQPSRAHNYTQLSPSTSSGEGAIRLNWSQGRTAPCVMRACTDAVVDGSVAYFNPGGTRNVYAHKSIIDNWFQLPDCPTHYSTLAMVNGLITTVGGSNSNKLFSLTGEGKGRKWTEVFPPMPTKRHWVIAVTTGRALIVAGGDGLKVLRTVEIMNTDTRQWSTAADLPQPLYLASATVCGDRIYMTGPKSVITCSLPALLRSCSSKIFKALLFTQGPVWSTVADLPVERSTLVSINNHLLAIGGCFSDNRFTTAVRMYNPVDNSWQTISHLNTARWRCFAVLQDCRIMVVGGYTAQPSFSETDKVEFGSVVEV